MSYHYTKGKWLKCTASKRTCPYLHIENIEDGQRVIDKVNINQILLDKYLKINEYKERKTGYVLLENAKKILSPNQYERAIKSLDEYYEYHQAIIVFDKEIPDTYSDYLINDENFKKEYSKLESTDKESVNKLYRKHFQKHINKLKENKDVFRITENAYGFTDNDFIIELDRGLKQKFGINHKIINEKIQYVRIEGNIEAFLPNYVMEQVMDKKDYDYIMKKSIDLVPKSKIVLPIIDKRKIESYRYLMLKEERFKNLKTVEEFREHYPEFFSGLKEKINKWGGEMYQLDSNCYGYFEPHNIQKRMFDFEVGHFVSVDY